MPAQHIPKASSYGSLHTTVDMLLRELGSRAVLARKEHKKPLQGKGNVL